jgi:D-lyxose ketol-isomerase
MPEIPDSLQIPPQERRAALDECYQHISEWKVAMPPAVPLVLDFGLGDFDRFGLYEFWIANEMEAGYCGKYMFVKDRQMCPRHCHRVKHETFFVMKGALRVTMDNEEFVLKEGETLAIAPNQVHSFEGIGPTLMLELSMPCDPSDNVFEQPEAMAWLHRNIGVPAASA